jgi:hypothetical protein
MDAAREAAERQRLEPDLAGPGEGREEQALALSVGDTAFASLRDARVFPAGDS